MLWGACWGRIDLHKYCWNNLEMFMFSAGSISQRKYIEVLKSFVQITHNEKCDLGYKEVHIYKYEENEKSL